MYQIGFIFIYLAVFGISDLFIRYIGWSPKNKYMIWIYYGLCGLIGTIIVERVSAKTNNNTNSDR